MPADFWPACEALARLAAAALILCGPLVWSAHREDKRLEHTHEPRT